MSRMEDLHKQYTLRGVQMEGNEQALTFSTGMAD